MLIIKNNKLLLILIQFSPLCLLLTFIVLNTPKLKTNKLINVNQLGYLVSEEKIFYVSCSKPLNLQKWYIVKYDDRSMQYEGSYYDYSLFDLASQQYVYRIDFSRFNKSGKFFIKIPKIGRSYDFYITDTTYNKAFKSIFKSFYYQRSGIDLEPQYAGKWNRPAEYVNDAFIYKGFKDDTIQTGKYIDTKGGWRDAGDPNKKVVPTCVTLYYILLLYEHFPHYLKDIQLNIPNDNDIYVLPDILKEVKFGLDWLFKMQRLDGAVRHAVTQESFFTGGMGHLDPNPRYILPITTTATGDFIATMSLASRVYKFFDIEYSTKCLIAAEKAWNALNDTSIWNSPYIQGEESINQYPEPSGYSSDPPGIQNTCLYIDTIDTDERSWASAELYLTTGDQKYNKYFKSNLILDMSYASSWQSVSNFANFSYVLAQKTLNSETISQLKESIKNFVDYYYTKSQNTGYGICLNPSDFYWGSNGVIGNYAFSFIIAYEIFGDIKYKNIALNHLNYIMGLNSLNKCFITGTGSNTVSNIYHLPSRYDKIKDPVPGLIPGGSNQNAVDDDIPQKTLLLLKNPPPAKCYVDSKYSFSTNEPTLTESAVWGFVTGYFYYNF